jgi:CheY-like chemotaxis protein
VSDRNRREIELDEFLAILSHELRNPVQAISTNAWLIRTRAADETISRPAEAIERQVARLSKVLDDVLDMVRISRKTDLKLTPVSLQQVVGAAVARTRGSIDAHRRELTVEMAQAPLLVNAEAPRLEQAIANILHNAVKYSPQQGTILVTVKEDSGEALVSVKDEGVGLSPEEIPSLFKLGPGGSAPKKHGAGGLGIGLHISRALIESHGGRVEARSEGPGKGSEFIVHLPLGQGHGIGMAPEEEAQPAEKRLHILVVDDNHDAADSFSEVLRVLGHDAQAAYGGREAIEAATQGAFDVALVDIGMPTVDGLEVARAISKSPACAHTLLVAITGWGTRADRERSHEAGFAYHLTKPVDYDTLGALLATAARRQPIGG